MGRRRGRSSSDASRPSLQAGLVVERVGDVGEEVLDLAAGGYQHHDHDQRDQDQDEGVFDHPLATLVEAKRKPEPAHVPSASDTFESMFLIWPPIVIRITITTTETKI